MNCFYHISFIFFILETSPSNALDRRCVDADEIGIEEGHLVSTLNGDILGYKETKVDPRQNKSVTWTSFYVGVTIYFFGPIAFQKYLQIQGKSTKLCMQDIPYAAPPVGDLRFHPPVSLSDSRWSCVRDGRRSEEKICPQVLRFSRTRSEGVRDIY